MSKPQSSLVRVGTVYDTAKGVYVATRKDGSITVGKINQKGSNFNTPK